jgi:hypothetical protein
VCDPDEEREQGAGVADLGPLGRRGGFGGRWYEYTDARGPTAGRGERFT